MLLMARLKLGLFLCNKLQNGQCISRQYKCMENADGPNFLVAWRRVALNGAGLGCTKSLMIIRFLLILYYDLCGKSNLVHLKLCIQIMWIHCEKNYAVGSALISWRNELLEEIKHVGACLLRFCADMNDLLHLEQLNGLSPVWVLSCLFKLLSCVHV